MVFNVSVQYNGRFLPYIILLLLTLCYYHQGIRLNTMKRFCLGNQYFHLKNVLTFFPPFWEMLTRFRCVPIFL